MKNYFKTKRGNAGIGERVTEVARETAGASGWESVADWALKRYDTRIRAKLRKMGIDVPGDGPVTVELLRSTVQQKSGLEIAELTPRGIADALDTRLAAELSRELGITVTTVLNEADMRAQIKAAVLDKMAGGGRSGLLSGDTLQELKLAATFARAGIVGAEKRRAMVRYYNKKYRITHRQVRA
jgi:hypothetical protein